jgi:DNA mismatch repair protein MutS
VGFNRVFGYYLEITRPYLKSVPPDYLRRQTLVNGERFVTPELKDRESKILAAEGQIAQMEYELFIEIRRTAASHREPMQKTARALADLDVVQSLATAAVENRYTCPTVDEGTRLEIRDGRHPMVEYFLPHQAFVPNDVDLDSRGRQILIITGPNMAGKSTYLRQAGLITILAQMGSFVPAAEASVGIVDRIFTRIGASEALSRGKSTFLVEMTEVAGILRNATPRSLILLDEVGRGTSTYDGISIAWAVAESLHGEGNEGPKTLFATHYHELTELANRWPRIHNVNVAVREWNDQIVFLRKVVEGGADRSYGIHAARVAGLPAQVLRRAREILVGLESERRPGWKGAVAGADGSVRGSDPADDRSAGGRHQGPGPGILDPSGGADKNP